MSKAVLISIQPKWCALIANGKKTIEIRKNKPNLETPFKCYIYCTKATELWLPYDNAQALHRGDGKIIGEFICDKIFPINVFENGAIQDWNYHNLQSACVPYDDMAVYIGAGRTGRAWHISDLIIYGTPKKLGEFMKPCENDLYCEECAMYREFTEQCGNKALVLSRSPQSWCYVEELPKGGTDNA